MSRAARIAVVDHGAGNLVSIEQGFTAAGAAVAFIRDGRGDAAALSGADLLVVPGVGAARPAMARLARRGLVEPIRRWIGADRPFLGICLGLQLLFEASDEDGAETLGVLAGRTTLLHDAPTLPHIGWNQVVRRRPDALFEGIADGTDFYFVHSYAARPEAPGVVIADTVHGASFPSVVGRDRLWGVQFHPERSGDEGLRLLANAARLACAEVDRPIAPGGRGLQPVPSPA